MGSSQTRKPVSGSIFRFNTIEICNHRAFELVPGSTAGLIRRDYCDNADEINGGYIQTITKLLLNDTAGKQPVDSHCSGYSILPDDMMKILLRDTLPSQYAQYLAVFMQSEFLVGICQRVRCDLAGT